MSVLLDDAVKSWLKNSLDFYSHLIKSKNISEEDAVVYTLLIKSESKSSFLDAVYSLANITPIDIPMGGKNPQIKKDDRFKYYNKIKNHIEQLFERFNKEFLHLDDESFSIGFAEIVCIVMIYYPEQTQRIFHLSYEKYCQLVSVFKEKVIQEYKKNNKKSNSKSSSGGSSVASLSKYGAEDLTAQEFTHNPLVGNEQALRKVTKALLGGESLIILGEAGVGKTTLVNGLAYNIKIGRVPDVLKNKRIVMIPISGLVAGTQYVGTLEEHVNEVISYARNRKDTIYFMDEIHMLMGAGQVRENNIDISNLLKPSISNGILQIIGATTIEEFDKTIGMNPAFRRRFSTLTLNEPTDEDVARIAQQFISVKSQEFNIEWSFDESFLELLIRLTSSKNRKYYETINNPNITLRIINGMFSSAVYYGRDYVDMQDAIESIEDNEVLSTPKKEELIKKLSARSFYCLPDAPQKSKILKIGQDFSS